MENRDLVQLIRSRLNEKSAFIQVIIGPRQVGKTTALKSALDNHGVYLTADYPTPLNYTIIEEYWKKALHDPSKILAIDEIQKIAGWSEVIKKLWDESEKKIKVIVTGSSALLVEKGLKETLAGRYELIRAEHWNYEEARRVFNLDFKKYIEFGCYPGSIPLLDNIERWGQYVRDSIIEPAIGRDLLQLHPVDQPALLRQVFGVSVTLPSQVISLQKMQGQLQGKGTLPTIQNYLKLLGDAFIVSGIEKYHEAAFRTKKSSPKLIIHDNGLIRAFRRPIQQGPDEKQFGHYFENTVGARFLESGWETYYWKDRDDDVDFVVLGPGGEKWAIEVKTSVTNTKELKGLFRFCRLHPDFDPHLVSLVDQKIDGVKTISGKKILSFSRIYT